MAFESRYHPLLPRHLFLMRQARHTAAAAVLILGVLGLGMAGYHRLAGLSWIDSFLNAAMILGGMGPVDPLKSSAAKVFAGVYALFAGVVFLGVVGVLFAPWLHRLLHRFHIQSSDETK